MSKREGALRQANQFSRVCVCLSVQLLAKQVCVDAVVCMFLTHSTHSYQTHPQPSHTSLVITMNTLLPPSSPVQSSVAMITQQFQNLGRHARNVPLSSLSSHQHHLHRQHQHHSPTSSSPTVPTSNKSNAIKEIKSNDQSQKQHQVPEPEEDNDSSAHHYQNDLIINNNSIHRPNPPQSYSASQKQLDEYYHQYMSERQQQHESSRHQALPALTDALLDSPQYQNQGYHSSREYQNAVQVQQYQQQLRLEHQQRLLDLQQLEQQQLAQANFEYEQQQQQLKHEQQQQQQQLQEVEQPMRFVSGTTIFMLRLLEDFGKLADDHDTADLVFIVGQEETPIYAHWLILRAR